jgi:hypothetical protein
MTAGARALSTVLAVRAARRRRVVTVPPGRLKKSTVVCTKAGGAAETLADDVGVVLLVPLALDVCKKRHLARMTPQKR